MITPLGQDSVGEFVNDNDIAVVDFYADWCHPCIQMLRILPNLAIDVAGVAKIGKINVDTSADVKEQFQVTVIPTFVFFKGGKEAARFTGVKRLAEIKEQIEKLR